MIETDEQLVEAYRAGDEHAFARLTERYVHSVFAYISRISDSAEEANDLVQETFLKTWKKLWQFDSKKSFKAWLFAIAYHTVIDWSRKRRSLTFSAFQTDDSGLEETLADSDPLPDELFARKELAQELERAVNELPETYKNVLLLSLQQDLSLVEIAGILKKPLNTVKSQYRRGIQLLRARLLPLHPNG